MCASPQLLRNQEVSEAVVSRQRLPRCLTREAATARGRGRRASRVDARHSRPILLSDLVHKSSTSAWTRQPRAMSGRSIRAKKKKKNQNSDPAHISTLCGLRSNGSGKGHLITWSGPGWCFSQGPASLSSFSGRQWRSRFMPLPSWVVFFRGGRMEKTWNLFCTPAPERWGVREERLFW